MLFIVRFILIMICVVLMTIYALIYCAFSPRNPKNNYHFAMLFSKMACLVGLKVTYRYPKNVKENGPSVYIANHQNNYDMVTTTGSVQARTVTIGKKSLVWIPFFGIIYWLTGNIIINREDKASAKETIKDVAEQMREKDLSVMIFPEGTRSRGRGFMPFKMGAFHTALQAGVNVVPTVVSNTHGQVKLNRWNNGEVIVEVLDPIDISQYKKREIRRLLNDAREIMLAKYIQLNDEVKRPDNNTDCCG